MSRAWGDLYTKFGISDIWPFGYAASECTDMVRSLKKMSSAEAVAAMVWIRGRIIHLEWENDILKAQLAKVQSEATSRIEAIQIDETAYQALQDRVKELEKKNG